MKKTKTKTKVWGKNDCMNHTYKIPELKYTSQELKKSMKNKWILIGVVGVDSGRLTISDPCYKEHLAKKGEEDGIIWDSDIASMIQYHFPLGHKGLGVSFLTGFGDGSYEVYGFVKDCGDLGLRITQIKIDFE